MADEETTIPEEQVEITGDQEPQAPPEIHVEDVLQYAIHLFTELAWVKMGIQADRTTGEVNADLPQARLAIDAISALVPLTEGRFEPGVVRDLHNLVSTLQLNYVQKATKG